MNQKVDARFEVELDLILEKTVPISPEVIWKAWTHPQTLMKWFCPRPWRVVDCRIDLKPGGVFYTLMRGPDGTEMQNVGCYLEIQENRKLVWTMALAPGFRPVPDPFFTAVIQLEPVPGGTRYAVVIRHGSQEKKKEHEKMGFQQGWTAALDQLVEMVQNGEIPGR